MGKSHFQRENLNQGIKKLNDEDFIMISDLDEILTQGAFSSLLGKYVVNG